RWPQEALRRRARCAAGHAAPQGTLRRRARCAAGHAAPQGTLRRRARCRRGAVPPGAVPPGACRGAAGGSTITGVDERWREVADRVFVRRHRSFDLNVGLVLGDGACLVVDTRMSHREARELVAAIRTVTPHPWTVVNT